MGHFHPTDIGPTNVIPISLKALVDMILQGPRIKNQSAKSTTDQPTLTISQMFMFNAVNHARTKCSKGKDSLLHSWPMHIEVDLLP